VLKGVLYKNKKKLPAQIDRTIEMPEQAHLRPVWMRPF